MIINNDLTFLSRSDMPNSDWTGSAKYIVDDNSELAQKILANPKFVPIEDDNGNLIDITPQQILPSLSSVKKGKIAELITAKEQTIHDGFDVGDKHYTLTTDDQVDISTYKSCVKNGDKFLMYHSDDGLCRWYTAAEITEVINAAEYHKILQTTYCNHLIQWVIRCTNAIDVQSIYYGCDLPDDLEDNITSLFAGPPTSLDNGDETNDSD